MKTITWLTNLAKRNPLLFCLAIVMIAVASLSLVVKYEEKKRTECEESGDRTEAYFSIKIDSINNANSLERTLLNQEIQRILNSVIENYQKQLREQKKLNKSYDKIIENKIQ